MALPNLMGTILLTDSPEGIRDCLGQMASWRSVELDDLPGPIRNFWATINDGETLFIATPNESQGAGWEAIAIIDRATESQFDALQRAAAENVALPNSAACIALEGDGFHGNRNRSWKAERGNLHLSAFRRCHLDAARTGMGFSMLPTVAAVRALLRRPGLDGRVGIKWVNDVLLDGGKVAGALAATQIEADLIKSAVIGLGMNVTHAPKLSLSPFVPGANSLADTGQGTEQLLVTVFFELLDELSTGFDQLATGGSGALFEDYRRYSLCPGREVMIWDEDVTNFSAAKPLACGRLLSIEPDLSLRIEGMDEVVARGRLTMQVGAPS